MKVRLSSLKGVIFEGLATKVILPTKVGEITVLPHHRSLITSLKKGVIRIFDINNEEKFFEVNSGFLEVKHLKEETILTLLVE